jgi:hypothetical protein
MCSAIPSSGITDKSGLLHNLPLTPTRPTPHPHTRPPSIPCSTLL